MTEHIPTKIQEWQQAGVEPEYQSLSLADFAREFDYDNASHTYASKPRCGSLATVKASVHFKDQENVGCIMRRFGV